MRRSHARAAHRLAYRLPAARGLRRRSDGAQPPPAAAKVVELARELPIQSGARVAIPRRDGVAVRADGDVHAERERAATAEKESSAVKKTSASAACMIASAPPRRTVTVEAPAAAVRSTPPPPPRRVGAQEVRVHAAGGRRVGDGRREHAQNRLRRRGTDADCDSHVVRERVG